MQSGAKWQQKSTCHLFSNKQLNQHQRQIGDSNNLRYLFDRTVWVNAKLFTF